MTDKNANKEHDIEFDINLNDDDLSIPSHKERGALVDESGNPTTPQLPGGEKVFKL